MTPRSAQHQRSSCASPGIFSDTKSHRDKAGGRGAKTRRPGPRNRRSSQPHAKAGDPRRAEALFGLKQLLQPHPPSLFLLFSPSIPFFPPLYPSPHHPFICPPLSSHSSPHFLMVYDTETEVFLKHCQWCYMKLYFSYFLFDKL